MNNEIFEKKLVITLANGIELYIDHFTISLQEYAKEKGLKNIRAFLSKENDYQTYLLVEGQTPIFENRSFEAVCVHIDALAASKE